MKKAQHTLGNHTLFRYLLIAAFEPCHKLCNGLLADQVCDQEKPLRFLSSAYGQTVILQG